MDKLAKISKEKLFETALIILFIVFVISMLPLIYIGRYNFPAADDYAGTYWVREFMAQGHGVISSIFLSVHSAYFRWQGTFFGNTFIYATPALLDYRVYKLVPIFLYGSFVFSTIFLSKSLTRCVDKEDKVFYKIIGLCVSICAIQQVPVPVEGFYWWTGAALYTLCHAVQLVFLGSLINHIMSKKQGKGWIAQGLLCLFAFMLGGSNYTTALLNSGFVLLLLFYTFITKNEKLKATIFVFVFSIAGLLTNALAPGNFKRMAVVDADWQTERANIFVTIKDCFVLAFDESVKSMHITIFFLAIFLVPVFYLLAKKMKFSFKYPVAVVLFTFCIYASQYAPALFTNTGVPGRMENVIFFGFIWMFFADVFYCVGYLANNIKLIEKQDKLGSARKVVVVASAIAMVVGLTALPSSTIAVKGLLDGTTQEYGTHMASLVNQCMDPSIETPTVSEFMNKPLHLAFAVPVYSASNADWPSRELARHYGKEKIVIIPNKSISKNK